MTTNRTVASLWQEIEELKASVEAEKAKAKELERQLYRKVGALEHEVARLTRVAMRCAEATDQSNAKLIDARREVARLKGGIATEYHRPSCLYDGAVNGCTCEGVR